MPGTMAARLWVYSPHTLARCANVVVQVESLMQKLAIEQRVQYGAEKMLDVSRPRSSHGIAR